MYFIGSEACRRASGVVVDVFDVGKVCIPVILIFVTNHVLRHRRMITSFPLVHYRWGRDVLCIVGVLGSLITRYDLVILCHEGGPGHSVVSRNPEKAFRPPVM